VSWVLAAALVAGCGGSGSRPDGGDARKDAADAGAAADAPGDAQRDVAADQGSGGREGGADAGDAQADTASPDAGDAQADAGDAQADAASLDGGKVPSDAAPPDAGNAVTDAGDVGDGAEAGNRGAQLVGHWIFATGSEMVSCASSSNATMDLANDYVDVTRLDASTLVGSYFCDWKLDVGPTDDTTIVRPGQSCSRAVAGGRKYTWAAASFTISSADGHAGTISATISVVIDDPTTPDTCSLVITGTLQK
jgi:hypothetical protein